MLSISIKETITIGIITSLMGFIIEYILEKYGHEDIKTNNFFYKNKKNILFYTSLFMIGIAIHLFVKYAQIQSWYCSEQCTDGVCNIVCTIPINSFTKLLITP